MIITKIKLDGGDSEYIELCKRLTDMIKGKEGECGSRKFGKDEGGIPACVYQQMDQGER